MSTRSILLNLHLAIPNLSRNEEWKPILKKTIGKWSKTVFLFLLYSMEDSKSKFLYEVTTQETYKNIKLNISFLAFTKTFSS